MSQWLLEKYHVEPDLRDGCEIAVVRAVEGADLRDM